MKIQEYQTKDLFKKSGIAVLLGEVADSPEKVFDIAKSLGGTVAVKAQVLVGGRGKAGGIKLAKSPDEAKQFSEKLLGNPLKGLVVKKVLVEQAADIDREFYLGFAIDREKQKNVLIFTAEGGVEVETLAETRPEAILKRHLLPSEGLSESLISEVLQQSGVRGDARTKLAHVLIALYQLYLKTDAELIEINPLVLTKSSDIIALDGKLNIDDNSLYRQPEFLALQNEDSEEDPLEIEAKSRGLAYVRLSGNVGIIGNGAGLVMGTMDEVLRAGGKPANFLDLGGGAKADVVKNALEVLLKDPQIKGIFINIFGGITRCDEVAKGIIAVVNEKQIPFPIVLRLEGTRAKEGLSLITGAIIPAASMQEGAKKIVHLVGKNG